VWQGNIVGWSKNVLIRNGLSARRHIANRRERRAPAMTPATDADGVVWTGTNTAATCLNWTSAVSTDSGTRGYTNRTDATWLSQDTFHDDHLASLLCICWSGGEYEDSR
jgi:hypothetical protein